MLETIIIPKCDGYKLFTDMEYSDKFHSLCEGVWSRVWDGIMSGVLEYVYYDSRAYKGHYVRHVVHRSAKCLGLQDTAMDVYADGETIMAGDDLFSTKKQFLSGMAVNGISLFLESGNS